MNKRLHILKKRSTISLLINCLENEMEIQAFSFGCESYLKKSEKISRNERCEALFEKSHFKYNACGNQEVYEVSEESS